MGIIKSILQRLSKISERIIFRGSKMKSTEMPNGNMNTSGNSEDLLKVKIVKVKIDKIDLK